MPLLMFPQNTPQKQIIFIKSRRWFNPNFLHFFFNNLNHRQKHLKKGYIYDPTPKPLCQIFYVLKKMGKQCVKIFC
jgi:hypothetical protein